MGTCSSKKNLAFVSLDETQKTILDTEKALERKDFLGALKLLSQLWLQYDSFTLETQQRLDALVGRVGINTV